MTQKFCVSKGLIKIAQVFYKLVLFILLRQKKPEKQLPIAFSLTVHKGSRLLDRIIRAIYVPNNVYCIHIDKNSSEVFRKAIQAIIRCLPNVFIAANSVDVHWGHITVVEAQFSCI